jgi:hypothetical protein
MERGQIYMSSCIMYRSTSGWRSSGARGMKVVGGRVVGRS